MAAAAAGLAVGVAAAAAVAWHRRRGREKLRRQLRECNLSLGVVSGVEWSELVVRRLIFLAIHVFDPLAEL